MRKIYALLLAAICVRLSAQAPQSINYQGVLRDQAGVPVSTLNAIGVKFTITDGSSNVVHLETQMGVPVNTLGLFSTKIGLSPAISNTITWQNSPYNLAVSVDMGTGFVPLGSQQLVSVPFALFAQNTPVPALQLNGNNLSLSGGNTVTLPSGGSYSGGTGISLSGSVIINTAPDQTVVLSNGNNINVSGTYPSFTIASNPTLNLQGNLLDISGGNTVTLPTGVTYTNGSGISILSGSIITNAAPDQTVNITGPQVTGTYPNYTISGSPNTSITGIGASTVTGAAPSFTVNVPVVTMSGAGSSIVFGAYPNFTVSSPVSVTTVNTAPPLTGGPITNSGTISLAPSGVITASYGASPITVPTFSVDNFGRLVSASSYTLSIPSNTLNGDVKGTFLSNTVTALQGFSVSAVPPTLGQVLMLMPPGVWTPTTPPAIPAASWVKAATSVTLATISDNVGIGTAAPVEKLQVESAGPTRLSVIASNTSAIWFGTSGFHNLGFIQYDNVSNEMNFGTNNTANRLRLFNNGDISIPGRLGIGTTTPTNALHVNGSVRITDGSQNLNYVLTSDANGNATWQNKQTIVTSIAPPSCQSLLSVSTTPTSLAALGTFTKTNAATNVEINFQSFLNVYGLTGANGVVYELRIDGVPASNGAGRTVYFKNNGNVFDMQANMAVNMEAVFPGLATGSHTVSIYVYTLTGSASNVWYDNGCWSTSNLTVKEYW